LKSKITPQADQVIFSGVKNLFNLGGFKKWLERGKIWQAEWVNKVVTVTGGKLDQANLFLVSIETVGFRVNCHMRIAGDVRHHLAESQRGIHPGGWSGGMADHGDIIMPKKESG